MYDPLDDLHRLDVTVTTESLPPGIDARWRGAELAVDASLADGERRALLAREAVSLDPTVPHEHTEIEAARRLIPLDVLGAAIDQLMSSNLIDQLGALVHADGDAVATRLHHLSPFELAHLQRSLHRRAAEAS